MFYMIISLCFIVRASCQSTTECGCSTVELFEFEEKGYHVETDAKVDFMTAYGHCRHIGMHLLSIQSVRQMEFIKKIIKHNMKLRPVVSLPVWTSGTRHAEGRSWSWLSTGEIINHQVNSTELFSPNHKENDGHECLKLDETDQKLLAERCSSRNFFICQTVFC